MSHHVFQIILIASRLCDPIYIYCCYNIPDRSSFISSSSYSSFL